MKKLDINTILNKIQEKCKEKNYNFLGFCDKEGNDCEYIGNHYTYLKLHCNMCGNDWNSTNYSHFTNKRSSRGCPECKKNSISNFQSLDFKKVLEQINNKCKEKNYKFLGFCNKDGNDCEWYGWQTYLKLRCNMCGNEWNKCTYNNLISHGSGCPQCSSSKLEEEMRFFLKNEIIEEQKRFGWLGRQSLDFYLPQYNIGIECQGRQHFVSIKHFGGKEGLNIIQKRDILKKQLCEEHGVKLFYYSNLHIDYPYQVYEDKEELLQKILEESK